MLGLFLLGTTMPNLVYLFIGEYSAFPVLVQNGFGTIGKVYLCICETKITDTRYNKIFLCIVEETGTKYQDFMKNRYPPNYTYQDFARDFTAEFFNASQWSEIFQASGAKYVVLTSKHHEGYTLWPSKYSFSWNSMDVGPQKDLIGIKQVYLYTN